MPRKPVSPTHQWVGNSTHPLDSRSAAIANRLGRVKVNVDSVVEILDVYCEACKKFYDEIGDQPCSAAVSTEHLIGGPTGTRKRRVHDDHDCKLFGCDPLTAQEIALLRAAAANAPGPRTMEVPRVLGARIIAG